MLVRTSARVVTVTAARAGLGATSVVVNLAAALARAGKNVLVLDENLSHDNVGNMLALKPRYDLLNIVRRDKTWREIMLQHQSGVRVLPAARAIQALPQLSAAERKRLLECLAEASSGADIVLVDGAACAGNDGSTSPVSVSLAHDQPLLMVLNATASAITESYALIKRMAVQGGRQSLLAVVNKARNEQEARAVFSNVSQVARHHLQVRMEYLGCIPLDEKLKRAAMLCCPVLDAFPSAQSAVAFGSLGRNLMILSADGNGEPGGLPDVMQRLMQQSFLQNVAYAN